MKMTIRLVLISFAFFLAGTASAQSPLVGTWEYKQTHNHVPGGGRFGGVEGEYVDVYEDADENKRRLWLFTEKHYSFFFITGERPLRANSGEGELGGPTVTDEQKLAEYGPMDVEAGAYTLEGDTIHLMPILDQMPDRMIGDRHYRDREWEIVGDTLRITSRPSADRPELAVHEYYTRIE
jgi:hypothetical protein